MNSSFAQVNMFANGGFESGSINTYWTNVTSWTASRATNGMLVADASVAYEGTNYISIEAKGGTSVYLQQNAAASAGTVYEMDGYLMTPAGANQFNPENAYVALTVKFYGSSGKVGEWSTTDIGNGILTTNWVKFTTAPLVAPTGTTNIQAYIVYMRGVPADTTTVGHVYVDSVRLFESAPKQSGGVKNCDFETKPYGYGPNADFIYWNQQYGDAFGVTTNAARTGESALQIWWTGQGLQQSWAATGGVRYTAGGYIMTPSWEPLTSTSAIALIYIEYLNAAGTVLSQATSDHFTTNAAKDVWTYMSASAVAPVGTVSGRTTCCVVMDDANFSGSVFFDDITMSESASTQTVAGKLYNPGFEDGTTGNAYELGDNLPNWEWAGGTNAGFIVTDEALDGYQSYQVVFPNNMLYQWFDATPGQSYVIGGYMRHPLGGLVEGDNGVTDTTAFASILCEFYNADGDVATTSVSVVSTPKLTYQTPTDTWIYYAVTNHAPYGGACSGKVYASYLDLDTNSIVVGSVFFDSFSVVETNITKTDYQAGALWNPGFEYSANGTKLQYIDSWEGLGFDGAIDDSFCRSGGQALKIFYVETLAAQYWDANAGWRYSTEGYVASPSGEFALNGSTGSYAMVIIQYLNETGGVLASYASDAFWATNYTPDTWTKLTAEGRAPSGTVTGRTLCALLGNDDAFSGAVWFDDMTQTVVSTGGTTQAGELVNPGFEDGDGGNAYDLYISDNLPNWEWIGGTNAGFIVDTDAHSGYQSMQIVFPNNLAAQRFDATAGMSYIVDGYMMTPSVGGVTDETAYATFLLEFFDARGDVITSSVSVVSTAL
ncbi:MAG: hypothetical protein EOM20_19680, partial [Spartobacteria bacterium]|nr:hypothetical protein [Spartobacteria bacterium]